MIPVDALSPVHEQFRVISAGWFGRLFDAANWVFTTLVVVEIVVTMMQHLRGGGFFWATLVDRTFKILFFKLVLFNAGWLVPAAINGFVEVGASASGVSALNPQQVAVQGIELAASMAWQMFSWSFIINPLSVLTGFACICGIILSYLVIALTLCLALIEAYVVCGMGVFMLGFGGWHGTSEIATRYMSYIVGVGTKLFVIYLIIGAGQPLAQIWAQMITGVEVANFSTSFAVLFGVVAFGYVVWKIPSLTASLLTGSLGFGLQDFIESTSFASRMAMSTVAGPAVGAAAVGQAAAIGKLTSLQAGGGLRGVASGMRAMGGSLVNEAASAAVPRLSRGLNNLQRQRAELEKRNTRGHQKPGDSPLRWVD
jgi:type IV secretion system protein TrbL